MMKLIDHLMNLLMIYMKIIIINNKYHKLLLIQRKIHFKNVNNYLKK